MSEAVTDRLSALAAYLRASGAAVGVGELLAAHEALAAIDPTSRREAFFALRAALCSSRADFDLFAEAFAVVFAPADAPDDPFEALGQIEKAVLPRVGVPMEKDAEAVLEDVPVPAAWSEEELYKLPGVGETITWARALLALDGAGDLEGTLGVALKVREDIERVRERGVLGGV